MGFGESRSGIMSSTRATGLFLFFHVTVNDLIGVYLILGVQEGAFNR